MTELENLLLGQYAEQLAATPQPVGFHDEGDVLTHTLMVHEALLTIPEFQALSLRRQQILEYAALLHDVGKISATRWQGKELIAPNHSAIGSRMSRKQLWCGHNMAGTADTIQFREAVCLLIRYHSFPPHAIDTADGVLKLHRIASNSLLVPDFSVEMLCILATADMLGRQCNDRQQMLDQIALCAELAKEEVCYTGCYDFPSAATRQAFFQGRDIWKGQELHDDTWGEVILMSGLPGVGKDTYIRNHFPDIPMISLDDIRAELRVSALDNQGRVANLAKERAREYLRRHQSFVWNATNITAQNRGRLIRLFEEYGARVRILYLEAPLDSNMAQNVSRPEAIPGHAILSMLSKLTPPSPTEAHYIEWITTDNTRSSDR